MKAKTELTAELVLKTIEGKKPTSMTKLAHALGYKGSVSSTLTKKFREMIPDIDAMLKGATETAKPKNTPKRGTAKSKATPANKARGKWTHDERSNFRPGSSYDTCYSILTAHPDGLEKDKLVSLLAKATGKDVEHAAYDAQVLLSARGAAGDGLNPFEGPRHRSCAFGFWVARNGTHVRLVSAAVAPKERP